MLDLLKNSWFLPNIYFEQADDGGGMLGGSEDTEGEESSADDTADGGGEPTSTDGGSDDGGDDNSDGSTDGDVGDSGNDGDFGGEELPKWLSQLRGENKTRKDLADKKTPQDLVDAYDELVKKTQDTPKAPEDPAEYEVDEDLAATFKEMNLSKDQAKALNEKLQSKVNAERQEFLQKYGGTKKSAENWARTEFGKEYEAKRNDMRRAMNLGDNDFYNLIAHSPIGNNPAVLKYLQTIGSYFGEDNLPLPESSGGVANEEEARLRRTYPTMFKN